MISNALVFTNLAIAVLLIAANIHCYKLACDPVRWIHIAFACVGVFWTVFYLLYLSGNFSALALQVLIRPGITVTLAVMVSSTIVRMRLR